MHLDSKVVEISKKEDNGAKTFDYF
jgi:hypothetical protein